MNNTSIDLPEECCAKCRFAKIVRDPGQPIDFRIRECHRVPPRPQVTGQPVLDQKSGKPVGFNQIVQVLWPRLPSIEWCGEFEHGNAVKLESATQQ